MSSPNEVVLFVTDSNGNKYEVFFKDILCFRPLKNRLLLVFTKNGPLVTQLPLDEYLNVLEELYNAH